MSNVIELVKSLRKINEVSEKVEAILQKKGLSVETWVTEKDGIKTFDTNLVGYGCEVKLGSTEGKVEFRSNLACGGDNYEFRPLNDYEAGQIIEGLKIGEEGCVILTDELDLHIELSLKQNGGWVGTVFENETGDQKEFKTLLELWRLF